jgi:hypothetical protein
MNRRNLVKFGAPAYRVRAPCRNAAHSRLLECNSLRSCTISVERRFDAAHAIEAVSPEAVGM